jgi:hypothetical protein
MRTWMEETLAKLSRKPDTAAAIRYASSRWQALTCYVDDGQLEEIDNNAAATVSLEPRRRRDRGTHLNRCPPILGGHLSSHALTGTVQTKAYAKLINSQFGSREDDSEFNTKL